MSGKRFEGQCLCGTVRFGFTEPVGGSAHCHCSMCRQAHGAAFVTWIVTFNANFEILRGAEELTWYESSEEAKRGFCRVCGSTMFFRSTLCEDETHVTTANLDTDQPVIQPDAHCFINEQVSWVEILDDLTRLTVDGPELEHYKKRKGYRP